MTVNSRVNVSPPTKELLRYGLFNVVDARPEPTSGGRVDPHWRNGVTWVNVCPDGQTVYEQCLQGNALGVPVTGLAAPANKAATAVRSIWGATPITVQVEIDCSPPDWWERANDTTLNTMTESEQVEVEQAFFSGTIGTTGNLAFPHLAAAAGLEDDIPGGSILQLATANVGPTGGAALDVVEAMGKLESALSRCVKGIGVIHMPCELLPHFMAQHLIEERGGVYYSPAGHKVAIGVGYSGASPAGVVGVGQLWVYATGPVFMYRGPAQLIGTNVEGFDHSVNLLKRMAERTYVLGYDCCLFGVAVSTGGVTTGAINSAT